MRQAIIAFLIYIPMTFMSILCASLPVLANNQSMTETTFMIDLAPMDPLREGQNIQGAGGMRVLEILLRNLAELMLFIVPFIAAVSLIVAGYFYIFSAGDSEKVGRAKTIIKWNMIAIPVAFLSYLIVRMIANFFS